MNQPLHYECDTPQIRKIQLVAVSLGAFLILMYFGWQLLVIGIIINVLKGNANKTYIKRIGLSVDDIGGTLFFGTIRHTISANIGYRQFTEVTGYDTVAKLVDYFFGEGHCYCLAIREELIIKDI